MEKEREIRAWDFLFAAETQLHLLGEEHFSKYFCSII